MEGRVNNESRPTHKSFGLADVDGAARSARGTENMEISWSPRTFSSGSDGATAALGGAETEAFWTVCSGANGDAGSGVDADDETACAAGANSTVSRLSPTGVGAAAAAAESLADPERRTRSKRTGTAAGAGADADAGRV